MIVSCTSFAFWQCGGQAHKVHETTTHLLVTLPHFATLPCNLSSIERTSPSINVTTIIHCLHLTARTRPHDVYESSQPTEQWKCTKHPTTPRHAATGNESVTKNIINNTIIFFLKIAIGILVISNHSSFRVALFEKIASVYSI